MVAPVNSKSSLTYLVGLYIFLKIGEDRMFHLRKFISVLKDSAVTSAQKNHVLFATKTNLLGLLMCPADCKSLTRQKAPMHELEVLINQKQVNFFPGSL